MSRLRIGLAVTALLLAGFAALAGSPQAPLAADEISPVALAERLQQGDTTLRVIDLRPVEGDASASIPGALGIDAAMQLDPRQDQTVVVFADHDVDPKAWAALHSRWPALRLLRLRDGLAGWNAEVMYPTLRSDASARQRAAFSQRAALSRYFGGSPVIVEPGTLSVGQRSRRGCEWAAEAPPIRTRGQRRPHH